MKGRPPRSTLFPSTTLFRSQIGRHAHLGHRDQRAFELRPRLAAQEHIGQRMPDELADAQLTLGRSEEHTSELQSRQYLVCRLLLEKKKTRSTLLCTQ